MLIIQKKFILKIAGELPVNQVLSWIRFILPGQILSP